MKKVLVLLFLVLMAISMTGTARADRVTWSYNGHQYEFVALYDGFISWGSARTAAQVIGSGWDLATITSAEEMQFIVDSVIGSPPAGNAGYWLGGLQASNEGGWSWVDGTPIPTGAGSLWEQPDQPDNYGGNQNHVWLLYRNGRWGLDDNNEYTDWGLFRGFIAEKSASVPEPATMLLLGSGLIGLAGFGRKRIFKKA